MAFFDSVTAPTTAAPVTPSVGNAPTPTNESTGNTAPQSNGGFFSSVQSPIKDNADVSALAPESTSKSGFFGDVSVPAPKTDESGVPSPYFSGPTKEGGMIGFSVTKDSSGKPLFAYRNPGDTSTTTDPTRVATTFDPRVPQKMSADDFYNPRAVANRAALKTAMGGTYNDELDHKIALELSGSNQPQNLQIEPLVPGTKNTATDPLETKLAKQVANGEISLFDAQTQLSKVKGAQLPWTGADQAGGTGNDIVGFLNNVAGKINGAFGSVAHAVSATASALQGKVSDMFSEPAPANVSKNPVIATLQEFPSSVAENLPFGVGDIIKQANADPEAVANMTWGDVVKSLPQAGKDFVNGMFVQPALTAAGAIVAPFMSATGNKGPLATGQISLDIPGLGKVTNLQGDVATKVQNGENPWMAAFDEVPNAIFSTLFLTGLAGKFLGPREVTIAKGEQPSENITTKEQPKSFQEYKSPVTTTPIPAEVLQKIAQERGFDLGKNFDPSSPTYFRIEGDTNGKVTGSIVQIKPSYLDTFLNKIKGDTSKASPSGLSVLYSQDIKVSDIADKAKEVYDQVKNTPNKQGGFVSIGNKGEEEPKSEETSPTSLTPQQQGMKEESLKQAQIQGAPITKEGNITLYHGTNESIAPKEGDTLRTGTYFTTDKATAEKFANQAQGEGKPIVQRMEVPAHKVFAGKPDTSGKEGAYWTLNEPTQMKSAEGEVSFKKGQIDQDNIEKQAKAQGLPFNITAEEGMKEARKLFDKHEIDFLFPNKVIKSHPNAWGLFDTRKSFQNPLIQVVQNNGLISDKTLYHEAFHAYVNKFMSNEERNDLLDSIKKNPITLPKRGFLTLVGYRGADVKAEEYAADAFADWMHGQRVPDEVESRFTKILNKIKDWIRKISGLKDTLEKTFSKIKEKNRDYVRPTSRVLNVERFKKGNLNEEEYHNDQVGELVNDENARELARLEEKGQELEFKQEALKANPASKLAKYTNKRTGELPEVLGGQKSQFGTRGDDIVTELGFTDSEQAREEYQKYATQKAKLQEEIKAFKEAKQELNDKFKEDAEKFGGEPGRNLEKYDPEILKANGNVPPPLLSVVE